MKKSFAFFISCFALLLAVGCGPSKPVLYFYTWEDYIDPEVKADFEKQYDCKVIIETFDSNENMVPKIRAGNVRFDVIMPTNYTVEMMRDENLIQKLDLTKLPNVVQNVDKAMAEKNGDPNFEYSVPYYGGVTGLGCLVNKCDPLPDSWNVFNCENENYIKRVSLLDDMRETIGAALIALGYDNNSTDDKELEEAKQLVISWKKNIAKFGNDDMKQDLGSGANFIIHFYGGDVMQMTAEDNNICFVIPKEGAILCIDNFVIPSNAQNVDLAHKFINFMCDKANAARNMEFTKYYVCVTGAEEGVSEETKAIPGFLLSEDVKAKLRITKRLSEEETKKYTKIWDEIKAAD